MNDYNFYKKLSDISEDVMNNSYTDPNEVKTEIKLIEKTNNKWQLEFLKEDGSKIIKNGSLKEIISILSNFEKQNK